MRASKRLHGSGLDDIGGGFRTASAMQGSSPARVVVPPKASPLPDPLDDEDDIDLYAESVTTPPIRHLRHSRNRAKAMAIADERLNRLSEELLELADELRYLNPLMADALDAAWQSTDEALEILADPHAW
ncbi:hypothetical protein H6G89_15075 [Oscillatoria sp. FACHB-1407]|uniref:hypothetical protein n=1 Tax=Oscillatoria sp. FACHB-1407 TaxID=2692847 RepID=UPI0016821A54|nr:hypothetical protein [Oscillatoria sp. FACHB-1407]MBD2462367.1 hypothetical protein [Oscillatoria sp. FACHB-1407]